MSEDSFETDAFNMLQISDNVSDNTRLDGAHHVSSSRRDIWSADSHEFRGLSEMDYRVALVLTQRFWLVFGNGLARLRWARWKAWRMRHV
jgi:hypothetical protein